MAEPCKICGKRTSMFEWNKEIGKSEPICSECREKLHAEKIEKRAQNIKKASDFKEWDHGHIADLFWAHLAKYQKEPNQRSLDILMRAYLWAIHDSHGLSRNFKHALDWCGINLDAEMNRTDLPKGE